MGSLIFAIVCLGNYSSNQSSAIAVIYFNTVCISTVRALETGKFLIVILCRRKGKGLTFPEVVAAKTVIIYQRREGVLGTVYNVALADRSCRR